MNETIPILYLESKEKRWMGGKRQPSPYKGSFAHVRLGSDIKAA